MRIRLTFEDPLPAYKCWYEVPASCSTIHDLQRAVRKGFSLDQYCKTTRLDLDGFFLLPASTIAGSLKDGDLLQVMIRRKDDSLPPRHLPVSGGKKRSSEDAGLSNTADRKASKKMKSTPPNKKPTVPPAIQDNAQRQQSGQGQQKQQPNVQSNKKNQQSNKKAKQSNSNNNKPQQNKQQLPSKVNVQGKANKSNKGNAASNTNTNNSIKTNTSSQNSKGAETNGTKGSKNSRIVSTDRDQSLNERRKVRFAQESTSQPKKTAMPDSSSSDSSSDSSSSSSSDTSHSNRESSDSSDSNSDSSDDSDSDSSSSESDSNKKDERKTAATRIAPGNGKGATKSRNARRKLLKMKLAEAREETDSGPDSSGTNPLKRHTIAATLLVDATPETPPLRTSGKVTKAASQANGKVSAHDNKKIRSPQANGKAPAQASTPPKIVMTSVDLKDNELMTKTTPKRVTRSSQKKPNGTAQEIPETPQPETGVKQKDSGSNKTVAAEKEFDDTSEVDVTPRDYHSLPKSEDSLAVGDVIAFKTLEMGPSYEPVISDFKEATVLSYSVTDMMAEVQLARQFRTPVQLDDNGNPILGKFDIYDEEEFERTRRGIVSLDILGLADCRIISKR